MGALDMSQVWGRRAGEEGEESVGALDMSQVGRKGNVCHQH